MSVLRSRKEAEITLLPSHNAGDVAVSPTVKPRLGSGKIISSRVAMVGFALVCYVSGKFVSNFTSTRETWELPKRPDDWKTWSFRDIRDHFACRDYVNNPINPLLPSLEYWQFMRKTYLEVVDSTYKFDDLPPTKGYSVDSLGSPPFYYAKASPGKGRGLFASRDIKKGEAFDDGTSPNSMGTIFPNGMAFRRFLFSLPSEMVCDATRWAWTQQFEEHGPYFMVMSFNIDTLMNSGKNPNAIPPSSTSSMMYATRDIKKDEEILTSYSIYPTKYSSLGL